MIEMFHAILEGLDRAIVIFPVILLSLYSPLDAGSAQRTASYSMAVSLHPEEKEISGAETLTWINRAGEATSELWFHLYLNAFKNEKSTFLTESGGRHRRGRMKSGKWGWIDVDSIRVIGGADLSPTIEYMHPDDDNSDDRTVMRVVLPEPVSPSDSIKLRIVFRSHLHQVFARSGYRRDFFMAAQWFPKIGVFQGPDGGWNCHQYHAHSEFFSDFGTYDVRITVPDRFVVGATGERIGEEKNPDSTTTYHYHQEDIHDFAWTASPDYVVFERDFIAKDEISRAEVESLATLFSLRPSQVMLNDIRMILLMQPDHLNQVERHFTALRRAIKYFGLWYGPYPYHTITVFDPPRGAEDAGGMEYPTMIGAGTSWIAPSRRLSPEGVIVHEFGHQYWYGLVANNEFEDPWLDEGFNTYSTEKVLGRAYGDNYAYRRLGGREGIPFQGTDWLDLDTHTDTFGRITFPLIGIYLEGIPIAPFEGQKRAYLGGPKLDRLHENSWSFYNDDSYWINSYSRPALTLKTLEDLLGAPTMARVMRTYSRLFRYRHPKTADFIRVVRDVSGRDMGRFLEQALDESLILDYSVDRVTSDTLKVKAGMYDTPEGRKEVKVEDDREKHVLTEEGSPMIKSEVWLRRLGEFVQPVDLLVKFEDGEVVTEHWDGERRWKKYKYIKTSGIEYAEVDPLHQILLDVNRSNNSRRFEPAHGPVLRWSSRWLLWMQNLLHVASLYG